MVAVNLFSGIGKMRRDFNKFETKTMNLIQRNAMLDAAFRTQRVLRLRSYPKAFPAAVNKGHFKAVTTLGATRGRVQLSKDQLKGKIERALARRRKADIAIFDATGHGRGEQYMLRHALGGIRTPVEASSIAVPTDWVRTQRTGNGIPQRLRPREVLAKKGKRGKQGFITRINGHDMIVRREGKSRKPITPLYSLVPNVHIRKSFKFYEDARIYHKLYDAAFAKEYSFRAPKALKRRYS